ncbi:MAG: hypothetical protein NUW23_11835 [Firmicutes bacterium]|nr:hypothetical protein [Bacillota bacterium]
MGNRKTAVFLACAGLCLLFIRSLISSDSLGVDGRYTLGSVAAVVVLWSTGALHPAATSLLAVLLLLVIPGVDSSSVLLGFASPVLFFLLGVLMLAGAIVSSGLAARLSGWVTRISEGDGLKLVTRTTLLLPLMAVVVPSALTRNAILLPVFERALAHPAFRGSRKLARAVAMVLARLNPMASSMFLTGGVAPAMAASLLGGFLWFRWLALMAVPYAAVMGLGLVLVMVLPAPVEGRGNGRAALGPQRMLEISEDRMPARLQPGEWWVVGILALACTLWLTDTYHGLPSAVPALIAAVLILSPWPGILSWRAASSSIEWSLFVVSGAALSLSHVLQTTGAAQWVAGRIIGWGAFAGLPAWGVLVVVILVSAMIHASIPSLPAAIAVALPLVGEIGRQAGLNPVVLGLTALITIDAVAFYPAQSATIYMVCQYTELERTDVFRFGLGMLLAVFIVVNVVAIPWWRLLGLPLSY